MDTSMVPHAGVDQREYFAAERTLLAWIRTGPALMGFDFAVSRFGFTMRGMPAGPAAPPTEAFRPSLWYGAALIAAGVIVNLFAGWNHAAVVRELDPGESMRSRPSAQPVAIALFLALFGLSMAICLVSVRSSIRARSATNGAPVEMRTTKLVVIRDPRAGTPKMLAVPSTEIGLLRKILVWQDAEGSFWVTDDDSD